MTETLKIDEERAKFEAWFEAEYKHLESSKFTDAVPHIKYGFWMAWQASLAAIANDQIVAYQDPFGNAVSAGDFDGGEDEMVETANQEGWIPLVRADGLKIKE